MSERLFPWGLGRPWLWSVTNVTALAGGPPAPGQGGAHAYSMDDAPFDAGGFGIYVTYVGLNPSAGTATEIHQLQFSLVLGAWQDVNLTEQGGGLPPVPSRSPVAYLFRSEGTVHVFYVGWDGPASAPNLHINELWRDRNGWHPNNLTDLIGAPSPSAASPCAYTAEFQQTQHVLYIGEDGHLNELWRDNNWHHNDLTNAAGPPLAVVGTSTAGFVSETDQTQNVHFVGQDGQLHGVRWRGGRWEPHDADIVGGTPPAAPTSPVGYFSDDGVERVVYLGVDGHVNELSFDGTAWQLEDPSQDANVSVDPNAALAAYEGLDTGTRRVVVIPEGGGLVQQFSNYGGPWNYRVLLDSLGTNAPNAPDAGARPGAFAAATVRQEYVFFPSINFRITALAGPYIPVNE